METYVDLCARLGAWLTSINDATIERTQFASSGGPKVGHATAREMEAPSPCYHYTGQLMPAPRMFVTEDF